MAADPPPVTIDNEINAVMASLQEYRDTKAADYGWLWAITETLEELVDDLRQMLAQDRRSA